MSEFAFCSKEDIKSYCDGEILKVSNNVEECLKKGLPRPRLLIIQVGDNPASNKYVKNKIATCNQSNIEAMHMKFPENITYKEIVDFLLAERDMYHSIILQLPLPDHLQSELDSLMCYVRCEQDIDGFKIDTFHTPATPKGIISYIEDRKGKEWFRGKHAVVIGRSNIVGKPISKLLTDLDCTVTLCHSKTKNIKKFTRMADLIIVAVGKTKMIDSSYISTNKDTVIIDVGINFDEETCKMCGDVNYEDITQYIKTCTPVPFGVGQLTKCQVVKNVWDSYVMQEME